MSSVLANNSVRRRRKRGRPRSKFTPAAVTLDKAAQKRKQWSDEAMLAAMEDVKSGKLSLSLAAKVHNVPRSTLHDRISGRVLHGHTPGPKPYLLNAEENEFANFLVDVPKAGYGKTRQQVCNIAGMTAHDKGKVTSPVVSCGWFRRFLQRQPHLSYRRGDPTANVRMNCLTKEVITDYFDGHAPCIIALKGQKKVRYRTSDNKNQVTVIACVSASGQCIPPFFIFDAKRLNLDWWKDEVVGTSYGLSDNGWLDR